MTDCAFDTLLIALHNAVVNANASIRKRREALLDNHGPAGDVSEHTLNVAIPQGAGADAPIVVEAIPLRLFRDKRIPRIAMMSIEFDCSLRYIKKRGEASSELNMIIGKPRFSWFRRRRIHRVRISYLSANAWHPQVEIDGSLLVVPTPEQAIGG
jgi:hypothetical protein